MISMADNPSSVELACKGTSSNIIIGDLLVALIPPADLMVSVATSKKVGKGQKALPTHIFNAIMSKFQRFNIFKNFKHN